MTDRFAATRAATEAAIQQVEENADEVWKASALEAVTWCAKQFDSFTADEVWDRLDDLDVPGPHTPSALGPIFLQAKRAGVIENTGQWQRFSRFARRHRALQIWRSLSHNEQGRPMLTKTKTFNVSQSKVLQWRRCRLQFHFANIRNLAPRIKSRPLYFGTIVHKMQEAIAHGKDDRAVLAAIAHSDEKLFRDEQETFNKTIESISFIMRANKKFWSDQPFNYMTINDRKAEIPFEVQIDDGITCKGTMDGIVQHKKMHWLLEHKSHMEFPNEDHRWSNIQGAVYITVAQLLGWPAKVKQLQGVCWNYIRSKDPTRPKLLKGGKLSQAASCDTLPEVVLDVIEEHKLNPKDYVDYIALQESNLPTWFQRIYQAVQMDVVKRLWDEFLETAREMADYYTRNADKPPPRTIDLHCRWCSYEKICRAELQGLDVDWVIEKEFIVKEGEYA